MKALSIRQHRVMWSMLMQLDTHRRELMSIGIGKRGTVRPSIAREIAEIYAEEESILNTLGIGTTEGR